MSDPKRLLEGSTSPLAAELLAAGAAECPTPEVMHRALQGALAAAGVGALSSGATAASLQATAGLQAAGLQAAGLQAAGPALPASAAAASVIKLSVAPSASGAALLAKSTLLTSAVVKWIAVGVVGLSAAGGAPHLWQWASRAAVEGPRAVEGTGPARRAPSAPPAPVSPLPAATPAMPPAARAELTRPAPPMPAVTAGPTRAKKPVTPLAALGQELARVDHARALLQRGDAEGTLRELARYESEFPRRQLGLEVSMLRMEASLRAGDTKRALELAEQILEGGASPVHAARARAVLEAASH